MELDHLAAHPETPLLAGSFSRSPLSAASRQARRATVLRSVRASDLLFPNPTAVLATLGESRDKTVFARPDDVTVESPSVAVSWNLSALRARRLVPPAHLRMLLEASVAVRGWCIKTPSKTEH